MRQPNESLHIKLGQNLVQTKGATDNVRAPSVGNSFAVVPDKSIALNVIVLPKPSVQDWVWLLNTTGVQTGPCGFDRSNGAGKKTCQTDFSVSEPFCVFRKKGGLVLKAVAFHWPCSQVRPPDLTYWQA